MVYDFFGNGFSIPQEWEYPKFNEVVKTNPSTKIKSKTVPYIPMDSVDVEKPSFNYAEERLLSENTSLAKFQDNDVLFARITPSTENGKTSFVENFKKKGINIFTSSEVKEAKITNNGVDVYFESSKGEKTKLNSEIVLSAIGIKSNTENIGLEDIGIELENDKILVDEYYQTNVKGYYAIGDVVKGQALAHVASAEGILCVEKITNMDVSPLDYNNVPGCTYCSPEIASVGLTEEKAIEKGYDIKVGKFPFSASGKAQASGKSEGFVKVIFDSKYGEWLGCHMIGEGVTDMIAEVVLGRKLETTGHEVLKAIHPHPTMSEAVMEAVADAYGEVIHL